MRARAFFIAILVELVCAHAIAASDATGKLDPSVGVAKLETKDLELLWFDPDLRYLTPYVARAYENSIAFQEKTFAWTPWDKPTILLFDISDTGNAFAQASPNNIVRVLVSPMPTTIETFSAGERFFTLMNHE